MAAVSAEPSLNPPPHLNDFLIGHAEAEQRFLDAWNGGRFAHAWLIVGARGIGKATLAYRIARFALSGGGGPSLFGDASGDLSMASDDPVFRRVASGGHADLKMIERGWSDAAKTKRQGEIPVDAARGISLFLSHTAAEGGWRVVIVDAVDELNRFGMNALLKPIEEPPPKTLVLLVCHSLGDVLPTILSRCRLLRLRPLADEDVDSLLRRYRPSLSTEDRGALVTLAGGSIVRALTLDEAGGVALHRQLQGVLSGLPRLDLPALHEFADRFGKTDESLRMVGELVGDWVAARATGRDGGHSGARAGLDRWVDLWDKSRRLVSQAEALNLDRKQAILNIFFALERQARSEAGVMAGVR